MNVSFYTDNVDNFNVISVIVFLACLGLMLGEGVWVGSIMANVRFRLFSGHQNQVCSGAATENVALELINHRKN